MVQPYDYSLKIPAPGEAFMSGVQAGQQQLQVENQRAQIKMKEDAAALERQFRADVSAWMANPTPEGHRQLVGKYPSEFQALTGIQKSVEASDRPAIISIARDALMAHRNKQPEKVLQLLDERVEASKDNPALQKKFMDMKAGYQVYADNPKLQESLIASVLAQDEEGRSIYNTAFKQTEPYIIAGNNVFSRAEIDAAIAEADRTGDNNIKVNPVIPAGAIADLKANPKLADQFDQKFGTPTNPNPSADILGGQTSNAPSGSFRK